MKISVKDMSSGSVVTEVALSPNIFQVAYREDILARVVRWQLAKRRQGTHQTKEIGDVRGTTKKPYKQKGTGRARQGSLRSPQFRKGAVIFGPVTRSHAFDLPKKIRRFGLKVALSHKFSEERLLIVDRFLPLKKTKDAVHTFRNILSKDYQSVLCIGVNDISSEFKKSLSNLYKTSVLPAVGMNVYDILRHQYVILEHGVLSYLEEFFA